MNFIKTPTKGMKDILPKSMALREYVLKTMKETYLDFGFELIQTPIVEHIENLTSSKGGENEKLIFKILKRGEKLKSSKVSDPDSLVDSALRYDLTVPLARFYAFNNKELQTPFRSFQIGNVYRAERSQKGRFREFMQCDLDILGEKTNIAEIELMTSVITFLKKLQFERFTIRINDRQILTQALYNIFKDGPHEEILIILDKIDKIGYDGVKEELKNIHLPEKNIEKYLDIIKENRYSLEEFSNSLKIDTKVIKNLQEIINTVKEIIDVNLVFDATLVRGMSYYTGPIFEIEVEDLSISIGGGGRYDKMIENYINNEVPACGFSIGFERLLLLLEERGFKIPEEKEKIALLINNDTALKEGFLTAKNLRNQNKIVKVLRKSKNYKYQKETLELHGYHILEK